MPSAAPRRPRPSPPPSPEDLLGAIDRELTRMRLPRELENGGGLLSSHYALLTLVEGRGRSAKDGELTVSAAARAQGVDLSTTSRQVSGAVEVGLVTCETSGSDKRVRVVATTPVGRRLHQEERRRRRRVVRGITDGWSSDDVADFARLLRLLNALVERADRRGA